MNFRPDDPGSIGSAAFVAAMWADAARLAQEVHIHGIANRAALPIYCDGPLFLGSECGTWFQEDGMTESSPERILRLPAVLHRTGLSRSTLYRKVQEGTFPKQVRIAARCAGWRESAINEWLRNPIFYCVEDHPTL